MASKSKPAPKERNPMHELTVEWVPVDSITLDPANVRSHGQESIEAIKGSLARFGQQKPIVVAQDGVVVAGNGTLTAARELGWDQIGITRTDLEGAERVAFAIADNRTAEMSGWDRDGLADALQALESDGGTEGLGFDADALKHALSDRTVEPESDGDEVPDPPADPVTRTGDLWILGPHRVLCGDSQGRDNWKLLMGEESADLVWTDPPYGVAYVGGDTMGTPDERRALGGMEIQNDELSHEDLTAFLSVSLGYACEWTEEGGGWYVAAPAGPPFLAFAEVLTGLGVWRQTITWVKDQMVPGRSDYHYKHEPIFYGWRPGSSHRPPPDRKQTSVWEFPRPKVSKLHPTMKPVELIQHALSNSTGYDDLVVDPFLGSGSTLIAADGLKRKCYGLELAPKYTDVIVRRWEGFSGEKATLESTGQTFEEVALERNGTEALRS